MKRIIRATAKKIIPKTILRRAWTTYCQLRSSRAQKIFEQAGTEPQWLDGNALRLLQSQYPLEELEYTYDQSTLEKRARERIKEMLSNVPLATQSNLKMFLDLGTWDGTTCQMLQEMGKTAVGIDIRTEGLTPQAKASAQFQQMDIHHLGFANNSFDFLFSYNSFEHFPNPEKALWEAIRVTRPGGYIYLNFGPLWLAPKGAHQFKTISVPYNQCLFPKQLLVDYAKETNIELMGFFWMNEWTLNQYRQLWQKARKLTKTIQYYEEYSADHVSLIEKYPTCFKSKSSLFEDFTVSYIEILLQKI